MVISGVRGNSIEATPNDSPRHANRVRENFVIQYAHYFQVSSCDKNPRSLRVSFRVSFMHWAVHFNHETYRGAVEVHDETLNYLLPPEMKALPICAELLPKSTLSLGHGPAKRERIVPLFARNALPVSDVPFPR